MANIIKPFSWEKTVPFYSDLLAFFFRVNDSDITDIISSNNATIVGSAVQFPVLAADVFDKGNATYWQTGVPDTGDDYTWLFTELVGTNTVLYSTAACRARLFFKDNAGTAQSSLPILVYNRDLSEAEQTQVNNWLNEYMFLTDSADFIINDVNDDYITVNS